MTLKRRLGLDILAGKYSYRADPVMGFTSAQKIPDSWVATTCGYCSVGCGMLIGVKAGKAVSVRGNSDHPVNRGMLCPKGLSEHHTIEVETRARYPLLRKNGKLVRVGWDEALETMITRFRAVQEKYGPEALGVLSTGQLVTEEFYALGKLVQLGFGTKNFDGNTTLCMVKTCVGTDFCRFGVQDSTKAGIELERRLEHLFTPAKVKMGAVGCPRNCAEATVKDIGLVGQEGTWQVVVGGAAGKQPEAQEYAGDPGPTMLNHVRRARVMQ